MIYRDEHETGIIPEKIKKIVKFNVYDFRVFVKMPTIEIGINKVEDKTYFTINDIRVRDRIKGYQYSEIPLSMYCIIGSEKKVNHLLIPKNSDLFLFEALENYRKSFSVGPRKLKYTTVYKSYEAITKPEDRLRELAAIRHSISHSQKYLTRPWVLDSLNNLFDSAEIDLSKYAHRKTLYVNHWKLTLETDKALYNTLITNLEKFQVKQIVIKYFKEIQFENPK